MKKLLLLSAIFIGSIGVNAQSAAKPLTGQQSTDAETRATKQTARLDQAVILTPTQKEKAYTINLNADKAITANPSEKAKFNETRMTELNAILTPEQQVKLKKANEEQPQKTTRATK